MPAKRAPRGKQATSPRSAKPTRTNRSSQPGKPASRSRKSAPAGSAISSRSAMPSEEPGASEFRLQKFLASAGLGSRRQCEELIRSGRITVDGLPIDNPGINVDPVKQVIEYDGERLKPERLKYFVLNKPKGVLCTNHDPAGRTRVIDLFTKERVRLFPVGRLDEDSEGLLIVTNDGDLANQLAHPRYRIYRTYKIQVVGFPTNEKLQDLKEGMYFREGKFKVMAVHRLNKQGKSSFLEVVLGQGHNREVRRLFARIGHKVISLERVAFGPIKLNKLKSGQYRELTKAELEQLNEILTRNRSTPAPEATEKPARKRPAKPAASGEDSAAETVERSFRKRPGKASATSKPPRKERTGEEAVQTEKKRIRRPGNPARAQGTPTATDKKRTPGGRKPSSSTTGRKSQKSGPKTYDFG